MKHAAIEASQGVLPAKPQSREPLSIVQGYGLALLSVCVALAFSLYLGRFQIRGVEIPLFLFAIAVSAWFGGVGPAALSLLLSTAAFDYFFTEPRYTLAVSATDLPYFLVFAAFASLVTWFSTVRRHVEQDLRQARDNLQVEVAERTKQASLLNLTHDSIFVRDMNQIITYWNRGAEELYGWTPQQAVGKHCHELLATGFPARLVDIEAELLRTGRWEGELEQTKADATRVIVSSRWSLQRDPEGRPTAILETNNDISDRRRREQEIQRLNRELEQRSAELAGTNKELEAFAYSVSHDLRAPLRHMAGYAELLQKRIASALDEKGQRYMANISESAKRMGNLIDDLLAFSRIGRAEKQMTQLSLDQLVKEAVAELKQDTDHRKIVWKIGALPDLYGDRSMLRLVFVNLVSNAVKFTRTRPEAEIEIGCKDMDAKGVVVFVRDNGVGFDMKYENKLFGVFQRLHSAESFEGTGIGLATVQRIVHRHGGRVWAEGSVNSGATFYFTLSNLQRISTGA